MTSTACTFSFNIAAWHAASNLLANMEQWRDWAQGSLKTESLPEHKPALSFLPAMQRRRLGAAARLVCEAAWDLAERFSGCPMVYASHDGEINRSFELWPELLKTHTVSPTSFGLSVHNALAGQWAIQRGEMQENTALATGADGLETALAEAVSLFSDGIERVLLVVADDPLKTEYTVAAERVPFAYALAMVIERGDDFRLTLQTDDSERSSENYFGALDWIRFLLSDDLSRARQYANRRWLWEKRA
ncbi:beta-ketoacyl synthase chain length factor [uncultured Kingella sp.]|mgnify:CR=1 FL=1|uniref:beta-ketoacyl synthase chain length factor n=1 Tax=uncultured Kingella sp. TaxID=159270 RepID=UPI00259A0494|nr:beta-ketoacyl synthase chain length factor [uncultured Kingella sp.]